MCSILPPDKDWIDLLGALLTPVIAALGIYIAHKQGQVDKNRLKYELFDKRYDVYEKIGAYIAEILISGNADPKASVQFIRDTKSTYILFGDDISEFVTEIYSKAVTLHALDEGLNDLQDEERSKNIKAQLEIKDWYSKHLKSMEKDLFAKYLRLKH